MDNILICDLLYVVNDKDFYMDAYDINTSKNIKLKLTKDEYLKWCNKICNDEQGWKKGYLGKLFYDIL